MARNEIICGDCLEVLPSLPHAKMIFADPPDNLRIKYNGSKDYRSDYEFWLNDVVEAGVSRSYIFWMSYYHRYTYHLRTFFFGHTTRQLLWRFTFGQHNNNDFANGYRPLLRIMSTDSKTYPDAIRVESQRQRNGDKRANPKGRVPDDVWEFPRVCGTFHERRKWHPNQHPEALIERIVKFSCVPGDLVIDMFAGTGTVNRVCKRLGIDCIGIEVSPFYCQKIKDEIHCTGGSD